jgi:exopolyphosphatase/guanosine-5'-triphosphate,3'-diphosphate pyrophosphatase
MKSSLRDEALALRGRYDEEPVHSDHVADLATQLFDALKPWHGLDSRARELLDAGALLHDIGWSQTPGGRSHHKESARLIRHHEWKHLRPDEVALVAQVARYHRRAIPEPDHEEFHALPKDAQREVLVLGGILRLADALDRTHTQRVTGVSAKVADEEIVVRVQTRQTWDEERTIFEKKRDMIELAAARPVRCEAA